MDKLGFIEILKKHELPIEDVSEDVSAVGKHLWHNDNLGINVNCSHYSDAMLSIVNEIADGKYVFFESELEAFSGSDVKDIVGYISKNAESVRESLNVAKDRFVFR